ncbi:MAG: Intracellular proteinase inhibitor [Actinomycetota bacterium]|jgi:hypothetical protein|nr:Intracellular proteinase inhibitor [Actinomycetota bacterium]
MPDHDLLPSGHELRAAPRPPAGLGEVLARATRRRRRQQAGALATTAAACAAVFAFTMVSGGAVDSLGVTPATQNGHGVLPQDTAPRVSGPDAPGAAAVDGSIGTAPAPDRRSRSEQVAAQRKQEQANAAVTQQHASAGGEVGPPHTMTAYKASSGCSGTWSNAAEGWCGYYDGSISGPAGTRVELAETLCRLPGRGKGTLLSDDGQQAEFAVIDQNAYEKWKWSTGHRFARRGTSITVPDGSCVRWFVSWNVVDAHGRPLPRGAYNLSAKPDMYPSEATGPAWVGVDANPVTFTVTS